MMNIQKIYKKYSIPINLQQHMLRVASLGKIICDHLIDIEIDKAIIIKTQLLHDMGNILKFDFTNLKLLTKDDQKKIKYFRKVQNDYQEKYGSNPDNATIQIIKEITSENKIIELCLNSHWELAKDFVNSNHWDRKIVCYCDMRVGPFGIISLKNRFRDIESRRPKEKEKLVKLYKIGKVLEEQLQQAIDLEITRIDDQSLKQEIKTIHIMEI